MTTDKSSEREALRPCPFCGGVAVMHKVHNPDGPNDGGYYVECDKCGASTNLRFSCGEDARPLLVEQWNRRAALPQQAQEPQAWLDVLAERRRQVEVEGWTAEHDNEHDSGEIAGAASAYALAAADRLHPMSQGDGEFDKLPPAMWPWDYEWWKPGEPRRMLVKAGALILAEIERLDRAAIAKGERHG